MLIKDSIYLRMPQLSFAQKAEMLKNSSARYILNCIPHKSLFALNVTELCLEFQD